MEPLHPDPHQQSVLEGMCFDQPTVEQPVPAHGRALVSVGVALPAALDLLGENVRRLRRFVDRIDPAHPHVPELLPHGHSEFPDDLADLVSLAHFALDHNIALVSKIAGRFVNRPLRELLGKLDEGWYTRLLATPAMRGEARSRKQPQLVNLDAVSRKGDELWSSQPDSFANFHRNARPYQEEIAQAEKKVSRYEALGCSTLAAQVKKHLRKFLEAEEYYGFNRITLTNASVIMAKTLGCKLRTSWEDLNAPATYRIVDQERANYEPALLPLNDVEEAPAPVSRVIRHLEAFPEAGGKPIFDHYMVLAPGDQGVCPASPVLGEKDGKCFFLCYFS